MFQSRFFQRFLLPGFVFQSIVIAGGYGTGRELVEYFLNFGPGGGLLAMCLVATPVWSAVSIVSFELARKSKAYEYRSFCRLLLGRFWWLYEVCYCVLMVIVLSVVAAAAGSVVEALFSAPYLVGVVFMVLSVGIVVIKGTALVEKFMSFCSIALSVVYVVFLIACFATFGDDILSGLAASEVTRGWFRGGLEYAAYNVGIIPAVLFTIRHAEGSKDAVIAGALAGPIAMLPGFFFLIAMVGRYPRILSESVPAVALLSEVGSVGLLIVYQVTLLSTLIDTGVGLIHAFNERVATALDERGRAMPRALRPALAVVLLILASIVSQVGLEDLVAKGYGTVTYGFWLVFLLPVLTLGVYRLFRPMKG